MLMSQHLDVSLEADFRQHTRSCWIDCTRGEGGECFIHDSPPLTAVQLSVTRSEHLHVKLSRLHATKHDGALRPPGVHLFPIASTHSLLDVRTNIPFINTHSHAQPFLRFSPFRRYFPPQYPICSTLAMRSRGTTGRSGCL